MGVRRTGSDGDRREPSRRRGAGRRSARRRCPPSAGCGRSAWAHRARCPARRTDRIPRRPGWRPGRTGR
ncbi:hypothetical protein C6A85_13100, partial [Mycobacterium sp. ITM-2017-0098]